MKSLTKRQGELLGYINDYLDKNMKMPTLEEAANAFGITPAAIHYHLKALEKKGIVSITPKVARGISLAVSDRAKRENISIPFFNSEPTIDAIKSRGDSAYYIPREAKLEKPFAFIVTSLSMKEAGILPNDIAIMDSCYEPRNMDIVLAFIPDSNNRIELRRYIKTPHFIELESENESMGNIKSTNVVVYGILKALIRSYK